MEPYNTLTGYAYAGGNISALMEAGYSSPKWATFKQWLSLGYCVQKGEKSTKCKAYGNSKKAGVSKKTGKATKAKEGFFSSFSVFNFAQVKKQEGDQTPEVADGIRSHRAPESSATAAMCPTAAKATAGATVAPANIIQHDFLQIAPVAQLVAVVKDYTAHYADCAASFTKKASAKLDGSRLENTPKRMCQASRVRYDGLQLERASLVCSHMADCQTKHTKKAILTAVTRQIASTNGNYYALTCETAEYRDDSAQSVEIRQFLEGATDTGSGAKVEAQGARAKMSAAKKDGFFPTPPIVLDQLFELMGDVRGLSILEPSAGMGCMAQRCIDGGAVVDAWEIDRPLCEYIEKYTDVHAVNGDCMSIKPTKKYDRIVMNPPYERKSGMGYQYLAHIEKMQEHLAPDGELWAIIPQGAELNGSAYWDVEGTPFEHTNIKTKIIKIY